VATDRRAAVDQHTGWTADQSTAPDVAPPGRCQFTVSPPRHFLFPALVLLLTEAPRHGYRLVGALRELGLGRVDRPSIYRALAELERDGLICAHTEAPIAGSTRRVYAVTALGEHALEAWMSIVAQERNCLELVLERYWYCKAMQRARAELAGTQLATTPLDPPPGLHGAAGAALQRAGRHRFPARPTRFRVRSPGSRVVVEVRSTLGPVAFSTEGVSGHLEVCLRDGLVARDAAPTAHMEVRVSQLRSGNAMFDRELLRRADARRYPVVGVDLDTLEPMGEGNCYRVAGEVAFHGSSVRMEGVVTATVTESFSNTDAPAHARHRSIVVTGEELLDVREFQLSVPAMPIFTIYPDVRVRLHLEASEVEAAA
jgi:DNA-binding PadR family transcriptional regulator